MCITSTYYFVILNLFLSVNEENAMPRGLKRNRILFLQLIIVYTKFIQAY